MKLVLVYPPFELFKEGYGTKRPIKKGYLPPIGIGYIAATAKKEGHNVSIVDASVLHYNIDEAKNAILRLNPDVIGIYSMTCTIETAGALAKALKKDSSVPIILGGPHATCFPRETLGDYSDIDYVVVGEGETVINPLLSAIKNGLEPSGIKGVFFRKNGRIIDGGKTIPIVNRKAFERALPASPLFSFALRLQAGARFYSIISAGLPLFQV